MGTNVGAIGNSGNDYLEKVKANGGCVLNEQSQQEVTVDLTQKPTPQAKTDEQILKESETLPKGYGIEKQSDNPVEKYLKESQERLDAVRASMKKAGIERKPLEYTGTWEDFKKPQTVEEAKYRYRQMIYNGQIDKMSDEEIDEQAKLYIENKERKEKFDNTHTYLDKTEYKKAEAEKDAYYKQLRKDGVSKDEAKAKAYERFGENKYLSKGGWFGIGKSSARKFIERNQDLFYENGKYSEEKHDKYVLEQAQRGNQDEGEATNYRYSLKERREATAAQRTQGRSTTVHQQGEVAKAAGMSTENNNTTLYRAGAAVAGAALGAGAGALGGSVALGTFNACGQLCNGIIIPGSVIGAGVGAGAGLIPFRDNGEKVKHIKDIKPQIPPVAVPPEQPVVPPVVVPPEKPCENTQWDEKVCTNTVAKGSSWAYYAENSGITINGKKPAGKELNAYLTAQQLMYGIQNPKGLKENRFLPVGAEYVQHSDFSKLFNDEQIMSKYGNVLNILKEAKIDTSKCVELNGPVRGRTPQGYKYGGTINNQTQIAHFNQDCKTNEITVTYQ